MKSYRTLGKSYIIHTFPIGICWDDEDSKNEVFLPFFGIKPNRTPFFVRYD